MFHPTIQNLVLSTSSEVSGTQPTLKLWNISDPVKLVRTITIPEPVLSLCCDYDGQYVVVFCRDKQMRLYSILTGDLIQETKSHELVKGCRLVWTSFGILSVGFGKASQRQILLFSIPSLELIFTLPLTVSPSLAIPYYDSDTVCLLR